MGATVGATVAVAAVAVAATAAATLRLCKIHQRLGPTSRGRGSSSHQSSPPTPVPKLGEWRSQVPIRSCRRWKSSLTAGGTLSTAAAGWVGAAVVTVRAAAAWAAAGSATA
eukprot:scaffold119038_cov48-Phaeocystis_antarctica.AAC.1